MVLPVDDAPTVPLHLPAVQRRRSGPLIAGIVAVVVLAVVATVGVVVLRGSGTADEPVAPAAATGAAAAPVVATPVAPPPSSAKATPTAPSPALVDQSGAALPAAATAGIREVFDALRSGDVSTVARLYRPDAEGDPWASIAPRMKLSSVRSALIAGMQRKPSRGEDVDIIYRSGKNEIGFSARGVLQYLQVGQQSPAAATSSTGSANGGFPTSPSDPYGCLAADKAIESGAISYAQHPCASHFQNAADPTQMQPDTPAARWAFCHQPVRADDPDYVVGGRKRYCH